MATWSPTRDLPAPSPARLRAGRIAIRIGLSTLILLGLIAAWLYYTARSALPKLDGSTQVLGISATVTVTRDSHGVPTLEAANLEDLFFAQGYVTAQDRLWQMDIIRRYAAGEISEIIGPATVQHDQEQRILRLR